MGFQVDFEDFGSNQSDLSNCTDGSQWIWVVFHQCVISTVEIAGFYLGLFSIICWFLVYIPQLYENYKRGRCDDALSIWFLLFWLLGDGCNLTGCLLTHQFPIQTMTAIYYVAMDIAIIVQEWMKKVKWIYYTLKNRRNLDSVGGTTPTLAVVGLYGFSRTLKSEVAARQFSDGAQTAGYVIGLLSTVFYLGSRLPQIIMNFKRGKTDGVHPATFLLAVVANFAYAFSVLMSPRDVDETYEQFVLDHLPWLTGSLGTVVLDFTILLQCLCLNKFGVVTEDEERPLLED